MLYFLLGGGETSRYTGNASGDESADELGLTSYAMYGLPETAEKCKI